MYSSQLAQNGAQYFGLQTSSPGCYTTNQNQTKKQRTVEPALENAQGILINLMETRLGHFTKFGQDRDLLFIHMIGLLCSPRLTSLER